MSGVDTYPEKLTDSEKFDFAVRCGELEALVENLKSKVSQYESVNLEGVDAHLTTTMSAKNTITFFGKAEEDVEDVCSKLNFLKLANNLDDSKFFGNILLSLKGQAFTWYQAQDAEKDFYTSSKPDPTKLLDALKKRFKKDILPGDVLFRVTDNCMKLDESVDNYLQRVVPDLIKLGLTPAVEASILVNGFVGQIKDQLKLRDDLKSIDEVERWARRIELMVKSRPTNTPAEEINTAQQAPTNAKKGCFLCNGPHKKVECPQNPINMRGNRGFGPRRGYGYRQPFQGNFQSNFAYGGAPQYPRPQYPRGVFRHRPPVRNFGQFGGYRPRFRGRGSYQMNAIDFNGPYEHYEPQLYEPQYNAYDPHMYDQWDNQFVHDDEAFAGQPGNQAKN